MSALRRIIRMKRKIAPTGRPLSLGFTAALFAIAAGCSSGSSGPSTGSPDGGGSSSNLTGTVARGQYLVDKLLVCGECHTPTGADGKPDMANYLGGSRSYDFPYMGGTI